MASDKYRFVGSNHRHNGERVEYGDILEDVPESILQHFPNKFEKVGGESEGVVTPESTPSQTANTAGSDSHMADTDSEPGRVEDEVDVAESDDPLESPDEVPSKDEEVGPTSEGYTREDLEAMTRNERVQLAKESDHPDIDGRSSDADILAALAADADEDTE